MSLSAKEMFSENTRPLLLCSVSLDSSLRKVSVKLNCLNAKKGKNAYTYDTL
jgi:hypothetical protein